MMPDDQPLPVRVECAGYRTVTQDVPDETPEGTFGNIGAEEAYFDLGTLTDTRPSEVWDGRDLVGSSSSASMANRFNLNYRICARSCDESPYPPPVLGFYGDRTDPYLRHLLAHHPQGPRLGIHLGPEAVLQPGVSLYPLRRGHRPRRGKPAQ
jgi:hypothetical protein